MFSKFNKLNMKYDEMSYKAIPQNVKGALAQSISFMSAF